MKVAYVFTNAFINALAYTLAQNPSPHPTPPHPFHACVLNEWPLTKNKCKTVRTHTYSHDDLAQPAVSQHLCRGERHADEHDHDGVHGGEEENWRQALSA